MSKGGEPQGGVSGSEGLIALGDRLGPLPGQLVDHDRVGASEFRQFPLLLAGLGQVLAEPGDLDLGLLHGLALVSGGLELRLVLGHELVRVLVCQHPSFDLGFGGQIEDDGG
ncbi:hypothetical protein [Streptomyces sp. NPDC002346]